MGRLLEGFKGRKEDFCTHYPLPPSNPYVIMPSLPADERPYRITHKGFIHTTRINMITEFLSQWIYELKNLK